MANLVPRRCVELPSRRGGPGLPRFLAAVAPAILVPGVSVGPGGSRRGLVPGGDGAMTETYYYEPSKGHGLGHNPFKAIVAPRPIGWISTRDREGRVNLAPYSFFNAFSEEPPI